VIRFWGKRHPLRPLEHRLLTLMAEALPPGSRERLLSQVERVSGAARYYQGKEVHLIYRERGKMALTPELLFPTEPEVIRVGYLSFRAPGHARTIRADFKIVSGDLFLIEFSQSPRGIGGDDIEVRKVKVLTDPMAPAPARERAPLEVDALTGWLADWSASKQVADLREPLPAEQRESLIGEIEAALPPDYLEICGQTDGLRVDGCRVHGLGDIRHVVSTEANYYVLAETERGVVVVTEGASEPRLRYLGYEEEEEELGTSLRAAVDWVLEQSGRAGG